MPATSNGSTNGSTNRISDLLNGKANGKDQVQLKRINRCIVDVSIRSTSPIIMHKWGEKAKLMIREKQQKGKKTKDRELRDPSAEAQSCRFDRIRSRCKINVATKKAKRYTRQQRKHFLIQRRGICWWLKQYETRCSFVVGSRCSENCN